MEGKNLRELLINTFELVDIVDKMRKCPSEELKESMYKSIKKDFELSLILLNLKTDFVNEKKRIKYVLRKVKWSRRKSWRLSVLKLKEDFSDKPSAKLSPLISARINAKDLYEMRLIFEPEAAYYAAIRATESEIQIIISLSEQIETLIAENKDRTIVEQALHRSIAKATHNEFMNRLMPIIQEAIDKGVTLSEMHKTAEIDTIADHKNIVNFIKTRNAEGARSAMKIHILHAIEQLDLS